MDRREALRHIVLGSAGAACVPMWVGRLSERALAYGETAVQASQGWTPRVFTAHQNDTVVQLSELIIPQTDTAGATAARVNQFIDTVLEDAADAERQAFLRGLDWVDARCQELFGGPFLTAAPREQEALLLVISSPDNTSLADREGVAFFEAIKRLTVTGYYTSEVGMREELDDDGSVVFEEKPGCAHPEHRG